MKYKVIKLDGRYSHRSRFRYMLEFYKGPRSTGVADYDRACRWFNENFDWSQDVEVQVEMRVSQRYYPQAYTDADFNENWASCSKYDNYRIYIKSEKELEWFLMANPNEA
jgi:hypothetical protein